MARTFIGQLLIRMRQDGAAETASAVRRAMTGIESAAGRLGKVPWGTKFDEQLNKLKVTPTERAAIVQSYQRLQDSINGTMTRSHKTVWRGGVLSYLSQVRAEIQRTDDKAKTLGRTFRSTFSTVGGLAAGGGLTYAGYAGVRGGVNAAFEQQRVEAQGYFSGLPDEDRTALKDAATQLSAQYGLAVSDMLTALQEAALNMPTTADAIASGDAIARLLTSLEATYGSSGAVAGVYDIMKAIDNVAMNQTPEEVFKALDGFMRSQQVLGKDFSPQAFKQMLQYSRTAGKALDDDFLLTWLPLLASETTGADAGTRLRASFDQLIVGRASGKAKKVQERYGLRDDDGGMIGRDVYEMNPILWANQVLLPALAKAGVDTENPVSLAQALGEITNNRQSSDFLSASLISFTQYLRQATERIPAAKGLAAADEVRELDPFSAVQGMVNSLSNLSGAIGEHAVPVIIPWMNTFASTVETVASAVRGAEGWEVGLASLGVVLGGLGAFKIGSVAFGGIAALTTAGPSLQTAALMLQSAATGMGGAAPGGASSPAGGAKPTPGRGGAMLMLGAPLIADWIGNQIMGPMTPEQHETKDGALNRTLERVAAIFAGPATTPTPASVSPYEGLRAGGIDWGVNPDATTVDTVEVTAAQANVDALAQKLGSLGATVIPRVDTASLLGYLALLNSALQKQAMLGRIGAGPRARPSIEATFSDYGIAP